VAIVAVSKKQPPEAIAAAAAAGMTVFGESRVQEAAQKIPQCPGRLEWHFIGHLQTNKVAAAVALFSTIHSVDSWRVLEAVEQAAVAAGVRVRAMLEVNVSGERSKFGLSPEEVPGVLERGAALTRVEVVGLMTVPPFEPDPEKVRPYFAALRQGRDRWARETGLALPELSMGMTGDYGVAIEEGATCVRIGTGIFGAREATP
jgi:pyridoxal phosphate enzyme (YggS family)